MQTLKPMKKRMIGLLAFVLPLTCLTACQGLKPFPADHIIEYDRKNKVCGSYRIVDPDNLKVEYEKDVPCPDIFGFSSKDIPKILDWGSDAQSYVKNHCH